jgi:tetratricopeptide (TPR) repeat protein
VLVVVAAPLAGLLFISSVLYFGRVSGSEFSPDLFARRTFAYYEIPLLGLQISPIQHIDCTGSLENYLVDQKLLPPSKNAAKRRWDLVAAFRGSPSESPATRATGDALILCRYLDATDDGGHNYWLDWTKDRKQLGQVVWPIIGKLAREHLYVIAPEVFAIAAAQTDATQLKADLDRVLANRYLELAFCQQRLNQHELAVELFTKSLEHAPHSLLALQARAKSLGSLGRHERAAADLAEAQKLDLRR